MTYEVAVRTVKEGRSEVWNNWKKAVPQVSETEFLAQLKWLFEDPGFTRELGCLEGEGLVRLRRVSDRQGNFLGFYREGSNTLWEGRVSISKRDRI